MSDQWLEKLLSSIQEDIQEVKQDVKKLNELKWKIMGGTAVISVVFGILIQLTIAIIGK